MHKHVSDASHCGRAVCHGRDVWAAGLRSHSSTTIARFAPTHSGTVTQPVALAADIAAQPDARFDDPSGTSHCAATRGSAAAAHLETETNANSGCGWR